MSEQSKQPGMMELFLVRIEELFQPQCSPPWALVATAYSKPELLAAPCTVHCPLFSCSSTFQSSMHAAVAEAILCHSSLYSTRYDIYTIKWSQFLKLGLNLKSLINQTLYSVHKGAIRIFIFIRGVLK